MNKEEIEKLLGEEMVYEIYEMHNNIVIMLHPIYWKTDIAKLLTIPNELVIMRGTDTLGELIQIAFKMDDDDND